MIQENSNKDLNYPVYAILLFTEADAYIVKLLKDKEYFTAINHLTGNDIALYVTLQFAGEYEYPKLPPKGRLHHIKPIWKEPEQNRKLFSLFDIEDSHELPMLVFFSIDEENFQYKKYSILADSESEAYNSLVNILKPIVISIKAYKGEEKTQFFKKLEWEIRKADAKRSFKRILETIALFRGAIGI